MNRLIKKSALYFVGNLSSKITIALIIPIYALFVDTASLGTYDAALSVSAMLAPVFFCAIWESVLRFFLTENEISSRSISTVVVFSLFGSSALLVLSVVYVCVFGNGSMSLISAIVSMTISYGAAVLWQYFARGLQRQDCYVKASIISALSSFSLVVLLVCFFRLGLFGLVLSYIFGQLSIAVYLEFKLKIVNYVCFSSFDKALLVDFLRYSFPLSINLLLVAYIASSARLFIVALLGVDSNGLYSFGYKFGSAVSVLGGVVSMAVVEEMILRIDTEGAGAFFQDAFNALLGLSFSICTVIMPVIYIFYLNIGESNPYYETLVFVPVLLLYGLLISVASNINAIFQAKKKTSLVFVTALVGSLVGSAGIFVGINVGGLFGAAAGQALAAFALALSRYILSRKMICYSLDLTKLLMPACMFAAVSLSIMVFEEGIVKWVILAVCFVAGALCGCRCFKDVRQIKD